MGLTVSQWADRVLDGRSTELPSKVEIAGTVVPGVEALEPLQLERKPTRLKTGRLPELDIPHN